MKAPSGCFEGTPVITPNGDNKNDALVISCTENTDNKLSIYDRYGRLVFEQINYDNTWIGTTSNGSELVENGYMWVLELNQADGDIDIHKGTITVLREQY